MENEEIEQCVEEQQTDGINVIPVQLEESYETVSLSSPANSSNIVRGKYYKQTYRQAWEHMPDFKGWLRGVTGEPTRAYCTYCQKTLHAHRLSLLKHTCTIRHQKAAQVHNSRKGKAQNMNPQEVHAIVIHDNEINQEELETEDGTTIEYAEATSDLEDEEEEKTELIQEEIEEDEDGISYQMQVPFEKHSHIEQNYAVSTLRTPISTHVLDTTRGCPVNGLQVSLYKLIDGRWTYINEGLTGSTGRFGSFIDPADFTVGRYKLHYDVDKYFEARKQESMYPFIEIIFDCRELRENFHIPVLLSPYGYTTYKDT